jgi:transcriptional regulator with XRE-family HTH domain
MTQSDLAAQLQVAGIVIERDSISRIEIGTRFVADYELRALAKILKVSVEWLLGIDNSI